MRNLFNIPDRSTVLKLRDLCVGVGDFESLKIISKGRFAEVTVVKEKSNGSVYVTKTLRKSDILNAREKREVRFSFVLLVNGHTVTALVAYNVTIDYFFR